MRSVVLDGLGKGTKVGLGWVVRGWIRRQPWLCGLVGLALATELQDLKHYTSQYTLYRIRTLINVDRRDVSGVMPS